MCSAVATFLREGSCLEAVLFAFTFSRVFLCCGTGLAVPRHISPFLGSRGAAAAYPYLEGFIVLDLDVWCIFVEVLHALLVRNFAPPNACVLFFRLSIRFLGALHARKNIQVGRTCQTLLLRVRIRTGFAMHHFFGPLAKCTDLAGNPGDNGIPPAATLATLPRDGCAHGMPPMRSFERLSFREVENRLDRVKEK